MEENVKEREREGRGSEWVIDKERGRLGGRGRKNEKAQEKKKKI